MGQGNKEKEVYSFSLISNIMYLCVIAPLEPTEIPVLCTATDLLEHLLEFYWLIAQTSILP